MEQKAGLRAAERGVLTAAAVVYLLACLLLTADTTGQDAAGRGMSAGFGILLQLPVWVLLCIFYLMLARRGVFPRLSGIAFVLVLAAGLLAAWAANEINDATWLMTAITLLLPPFAASFGMLAGSAPPNDRWKNRSRTIAYAGAALALIVPVYVHWFAWFAAAPDRAAELEAVKARIEKEDAESQAAEQARFEAFGPTTPIDTFTRFLDPVDRRYAEATRRLKALPNRQEKVLHFLNGGGWSDRLQFQDWDLEPDANLCRAYSEALMRRLARYRAPQHSESPMELIDQIATMRWLSGNGCDLRQPAAALEKQLQADGADPERYSGLAELRAVHEGQ